MSPLSSDCQVFLREGLLPEEHGLKQSILIQSFDFLRLKHSRLLFLKYKINSITWFKLVITAFHFSCVNWQQYDP